MNIKNTLRTITKNASIILLIELLLISFSSLYAQKHKLYFYNKDNGLENEHILSITQDTLGYMWLGTDHGLVRYDGKAFHKEGSEVFEDSYVGALYTRKNGDLITLNSKGLFHIERSVDGTYSYDEIIKGSNTPSDSTLFYGGQIYEDKSKNLWVGDGYRIFKISENPIEGSEKLAIEFFDMDEKNRNEDMMRSYSFVENDKEELFVFSPSGHIYKFVAGEFVEIPHSLNLKDIHSVIFDKNNSFIVGSVTNGLGILKIEKGSVKDWKVIDGSLEVTHILKKSVNFHWVVTLSAGVKILGKPNGQYVLRHHFLRNNGGNFIYSKKGDSWLGTSNGLAFMKSLPFKSLANAQSDEHIQDLILDRNRLAFTDGLSIYDGHVKGKGKFKLNRKIDTKGATFLKLHFDKRGLWSSDTQGFLTYWKDGVATKQHNLSDLGKAIHGFEFDKKGNIWIGQDNVLGLVKIGKDGLPKVYGTDDGLTGEITVVRYTPSQKLYVGGKRSRQFASISEDDNNTRVPSSKNSSNLGAYLFVYNDSTDSFDNLSLPLNIDEKNRKLEVVDILELPDSTVVLGTNLGVFKYDFDENIVTQMSLGLETSMAVKAIALDFNKRFLWVSNSHGIIKVDLKTGFSIPFKEQDGIPSIAVTPRSLVTSTVHGSLYAGTTSGVIFGNTGAYLAATEEPIILSADIDGKHYSLEEARTIPENNYIKFYFEVAEFPRNDVEVQVRIKGKDGNWSKIGEQYDFIEVGNMPQGKYSLELRARGTGNRAWSKITSFDFVSYRKWYMRWWALLIYVGAVILIVFVIVRINLYRSKREREKLTALVQERTKEVEKQAEELENKNKEVNLAFNKLKRSEAILSHNAQELEKEKKKAEEAADKLKTQNQKLEESAVTVQEQNSELMDHQNQIIKQSEALRKQRELVEKQHENMMGSINYAHRIQKALLGEPEDIERKIHNFGEDWDAFILFKPRDIVSGDFYWCTEKGGKYFVVAADCTGHGIPGAFMSLIGNDLLHQVVHERGILDPGRILKTMHSLIQTALKQKSSQNRDGMDISVCVINPSMNTLSFAGAGNPLYYINKDSDEMQVIKGQRYGVGGKEIKRRKVGYQTHVLKLDNLDKFYIFSDGMIDQFGGREGRKLMSKNFRRLLFDIKDKDMNSQKVALEQFLKQWTADGHFKQIDDILVIGVKCNMFEYETPIFSDDELHASDMKNNTIM